ncbi:general stress protein [Lyngbya aestuarii]|uniref:general stress protein n=1 Tax=Lyngbya aestuarii TaxID=118322 RepID=UPI00403D9B8B
MTLRRDRRAVGVFSSRRDAELALRELKDSKFPMDHVSVVARDAEHQDHDKFAGADVRDHAGNKADEGAAAGALTGGTLGGLTGLLVGLGTLAIPGIGPIMLAGATATAIATTLAGGAIGAATGGIMGALVGLGIPEERARVYNERVSRGDYLVIVDGTQEEIHRAEAILGRRGIQEWEVYDTPETHAATSQTTAMQGNYRRAVGVFPYRLDAEAAIRELREADFPMGQISIVGKDTNSPGQHHDSNLADRTMTDEGAKVGASTGGVLGGLGGLLVGLGTLAIPGVGPVLAGGALATALATTVAGGAIGAAAGGVGGALIGLGVPENRARVYNERVTRGDYLVMVDGTPEEIHHAEDILNHHGVQEWGVYDPSEVDASAPSPVAAERKVISDEGNFAGHKPNVQIIDHRKPTL